MSQKNQFRNAKHSSVAICCGPTGCDRNAVIYDGKCVGGDKKGNVGPCSCNVNRPESECKCPCYNFCGWPQVCKEVDIINETATTPYNGLDESTWLEELFLCFFETNSGD